MSEIKQHPWFLRNFPRELIEGERTRYQRNKPAQTVEEIIRVVEEARRPAAISSSSLKSPLVPENVDESDADADIEDVETSGDFLDLDFSVE